MTSATQTAMVPQAKLEESKKHKLPEVPVLRPKPAYQFLKRTIDVCVGSLAIVLLSPVFIVSALLVRITSKGPIFFSQKRVGLQGETFTCYKFRSMVVNADEIKDTLTAENYHEDPRTFKMKRDPRITMVGFWLRRASIDELPQLLNVILGDMSLVGPRPPVPNEVRMYTAHNMGRLSVKPGLTCIWQVSGRSDISFDQQVEMDLDYIERRSTLFDLKLLLLTVPALLSCRGAY